MVRLFNIVPKERLDGGSVDAARSNKLRNHRSAVGNLVNASLAASGTPRVVCRRHHRRS
jgi:hypothetical protein